MNINPLKSYFDKRALTYDQLYDSHKFPRFYRFGLLRSIPMRWTYNFTLNYLTSLNLNEKKAIDIGCGVGVYTVALARKGAFVTALDSSESMVASTNRRVNTSGLGDKVEVVTADFSEWCFARSLSYDLALVIGVMDYIENPQDFLRSVGDVAEKAIITFPRQGILARLAQAKYRSKGFRGYSYSVEEIKKLLSMAGFKITVLYHLFPAGFWVFAEIVNYKE